MPASPLTVAGSPDFGGPIIILALALVLVLPAATAQPGTVTDAILQVLKAESSEGTHRAMSDGLSAELPASLPGASLPSGPTVPIDGSLITSVPANFKACKAQLLFPNATGMPINSTYRGCDR